MSRGITTAAMENICRVVFMIKRGNDSCLQLRNHYTNHYISGTDGKTYGTKIQAEHKDFKRRKSQSGENRREYYVWNEGITLHHAF